MTGTRTRGSIGSWRERSAARGSRSRRRRRLAPRRASRRRSERRPHPRRPRPACRPARRQRPLIHWRRNARRRNPKAMTATPTGRSPLRSSSSARWSSSASRWSSPAHGDDRERARVIVSWHRTTTEPEIFRDIPRTVSVVRMLQGARPKAVPETTCRTAMRRRSSTTHCVGCGGPNGGRFDRYLHGRSSNALLPRFNPRLPSTRATVCSRS